MEYTRGTPMPSQVQEWFLPLWRQYLKEYEQTGYFQGSETGEKPTKFAMKMMGMEESEINQWYPSQKHVFITVRLNNETPLAKIEEKLENMTFKWLTVGAARLELYSTNMTRNHHVHILSTFAAKTRIIRDLSRYFKVPKENVDVKSSDKCELYDKRSNYILGNKQELKTEAIEADTKELENQNIKQIYEIENI